MGLPAPVLLFSEDTVLFKSVFMKYITAFLLINLGTMLILTSIIASLVSGYNTDTKIEEVKNITSYLTDYFERNIPEKDGGYRLREYINENTDELSEIIKIMGTNTYSFRLIVTDDSGTLLLSGGELEGKPVLSESGKSREKGMAPELFQAAISEKLNVFISDLGGKLAEKQLFCTGRITSPYGELLGIIIISTEPSGMTSLLNATVKTIIMSTLWIMLAVLIVVYFITEKLVQPIREMGRASKEFAAGRFDVRVPVRGNDEIAELGKAFNNMASSLSTNEEMRRLFLANVSHDLRTPMTTISGFIDGMLDGAIPDDQRDYYLGIVATETRRLSRLVSALLDITMIQAGERKFSKVSFNVCEMCRQIVISSVQRIEQKGLSLRFDADEDNMYVLADSDAIHQIIYNLVDNAIKFSYEKSEFEIGIHDDGKKILVSVYNEGEGIGPEDLPYVFDRFYKSDKSRGLDKTGSGLGLYIAKTICEANGETITAESEEGKWCRFTFTLEKSENPKKQS